MTVHIPPKPPEDSLPVIFGGILFLIGLLVAVIWTVFTITAPKAEPAETFVDEFCTAWPNGIVVSLYNAGANPDAAVAAAQDLPTLAGIFAVDPALFACDPTLVKGDSPEAAWCYGLAYGYLAASRVQGFGEPPQGAATFIEEGKAQCVDYGVAFDPPIPGSGLNTPLGGGGGPNVND